MRKEACRMPYNAIIALFLTFESRQILISFFWQNWPTLCALQLLCCCEDLTTNILGLRAANMKMQKIDPTGQFWPKMQKVIWPVGGIFFS